MPAGYIHRCYHRHHCLHRFSAKCFIHWDEMNEGRETRRLPYVVRWKRTKIGDCDETFAYALF